MRKRKVGRYGNAWVIKLKPMDVKDLKLFEGKEVDIDDLNLLKQEKKK